ncbi:MAG: hypothetical protein GY797_09900, partial [Deltaproteobacteria bacterium]|nr:hypothetical protein [Deltaproteobacteria bacterium]
MTHSDGKIESPILESSWQRYAEFRKNSTDTTTRRVFLVRLAVILALAAVIMAVLIDTEIHLAWPVLVSESFRIGLVVVLIIDFIVLAMAIGSTQSQSSQALRAAAEEIKKEIYLYRTVMQWHDRRDHWLSQRVAKIKR